ncbi:hypothetical protein [Brevundimonas sp.]|uniref:hypothetical protein n=1 Tax=Brevundimonas sp. TaxID=1871086 RepID=UPI002ED953E5
MLIAILFAALAGLAEGRQEPLTLGYPVTVDLNDAECSFLVQDMWARDPASVEQWMASLPDKALRVDIVWSDEQDQQCVGSARSAVERAGFSRIVVRRGSPSEYPDLLRRSAPGASVP